MGLVADKFLEEANSKVNEFVNDTTKGENDLQIILRGHLYIEHEIEKLLRLVLVEPNVILNERFMFMNKVNLAVALGLLPKNRVVGYKKINSLRNKYAHRLKFELSEQDLEEIKSSFVPEVNTLYKDELSSLGDNGVLSQIKCILAAFWGDIMYLFYDYEIGTFEKAFDRINELEKPPSKEELEKRRSEVHAQLKARYLVED